MGRPDKNPVIHAQPAAGQPNGVPMTGAVNNQPSNWTSGLFDCMNDGENALITCCFPFITFGQIAEVIDEGASSCGTSGMLYGLICCLLGIPCVYSCTFRAKIRSKYGLPDAPAPDCITHCFCEYCALCQEYRELKTRGLDPAIGWSGNVQKAADGSAARDDGSSHGSTYDGLTWMFIFSLTIILFNMYFLCVFFFCVLIYQIYDQKLKCQSVFVFVG